MTISNNPPLPSQSAVKEPTAKAKSALGGGGLTGAVVTTSKKADAAGPLFETEQKLETALMEQIAEAVLEALHLVGVADEGVKAEVCRVVIQGGVMLDGKGFMEHRSIVEDIPKAA